MYVRSRNLYLIITLLILVFDRASSNPDRSALYKYNICVYNLWVSDRTHIEGSQPLLLQLNLYWEGEIEEEWRRSMEENVTREEKWPFLSRLALNRMTSVRII